MQILGIDIGGSGVKAALVDSDTGQLVATRLQLPTPQPATPEAIAATLIEVARQFDWRGPIGCGFPAAIRKGIVCTAANIAPAWIGVDIQALLARRLGTAVTILNDADAAGLAEMQFGAGHNRSGTVIMITAGTGLGTALFRDGVLVPNTELGHLLLDGQDAEQYASAAVKTRLGLSYPEWAARFNRYLERLEELFWPDLFIIGGAISHDYREFCDDLSTRLTILPARLGNDAGIIGAALATAQLEPHR